MEDNWAAYDALRPFYAEAAILLGPPPASSPTC